MEGVVRLRAIVGKDGTLLQPRVINSIDPRLAKAALDAVANWLYQPSLLNGEPGLSCLSAYGSGEDAVRGIPNEIPDVVLVDIKLPRMNGGRQPLDFIRPPVTDWTLMEPLCRLTTLALLAISGTLLAATEPAINYNIHLWEPGKVPLSVVKP